MAITHAYTHLSALTRTHVSVSSDDKHISETNKHYCYRYDGEWADDRRSGRGVQSYVDAKAGGQVVERFDGDWLDGKMHGAGRYEYI